MKQFISSENKCKNHGQNQAFAPRCKVFGEMVYSSRLSDEEIEAVSQWCFVPLKIPADSYSPLLNQYFYLLWIRFDISFDPSLDSSIT